MSMKRLYTMMAMAGMMGGMGMPSMSSPHPKRTQPKLSPEQEAEELERRKNSFLLDLEKHNTERKQNFPKFKEFEVQGLVIIAFNQKNAQRDMEFLMRKNLISFQQ